MARKITRNGKVLYEGIVYSRTERGESGRLKVYRRVYGRTRREVAARKLEAISERDGLPRAERPDMRLSELAELYSKRVLPSRRPKTRQMYKTALVKRILGTPVETSPGLAPIPLGDIPLGSITTETVEQWMAALAEQTYTRRNAQTGKPETVRRHGDASINVARMVLVAILNRGKKWGYVSDRNPAEHADRRRVDPKRPNIYEPAEIFAIAAAGLQRRQAAIGKRGFDRGDVLLWRGARDATMTMVLAFAGLRIGELLALRWSDVRATHLRVAHAQHPDDPLGPTKTGESRDVPMTGEVLRALEWWKAVSRHTKRGDWIFHGHDSATIIDGDTLSGAATPVWSGSWRKVFIENAAWAGFPEARPHDMRHTFASLAIANGVSTIELSAMMGHSDETTTRLYTHLYKHRRDQTATGWTDNLWT